MHLGICEDANCAIATKGQLMNITKTDLSALKWIATMEYESIIIL